MTIRKVNIYIILAAIICLILTANASADENRSGIIKVSIGSTKIIKITDQIKRISVGNPTLMDYNVMSKDELIVLGLKAGKTELHLWYETSFSTYIVEVYDDVQELKGKIAEILGPQVGSQVFVHIVKDTAVLKGSVSSTYESEQVEKITALYYPKTLNLIEVKVKQQAAAQAPASIDISKNFKDTPEYKNATVVNFTETKPAEQAATVAPAAAAAPAIIPQPDPGKPEIKTTDILDIKVAEKFKPNENAYGVDSAHDADVNVKLPSSTISKADYDRVNTKTTRLVTMQYATAAEIAASLEKIKSPDGLLITDARTNSLVMIDEPATIQKMENLIKALDAPVPQVLIEAKIVEVGLNDDMTNTLNWIYETLYNGTNPLGTSLNNKAIKFNNGDLDMTLDYGKISSDHFTTKILPSLKNRHARLVSSPSTVTLNKQKATFAVTDNIPYLKYTPQGTTGTLVPTPEILSPAPGVTLIVTPTINQKDTIKMDLDITSGAFVENVNFGQYGSIPRTSSKKTTNIVEIKNGETLIISGLITSNVFQSANKVPWFSKIPMVGGLFSNKISGNSRTELLIFITPKVVGNDSRFAVVDREKFPKIAENKMPNVNDEMDIQKFLGIKKDEKTEPAKKQVKKEEKTYVKKTVRSDYVVPKPEKPFSQVMTMEKPTKGKYSFRFKTGDSLPAIKTPAEIPVKAETPETAIEVKSEAPAVENKKVKNMSIVSEDVSCDEESVTADEITVVPADEPSPEKMKPLQSKLRDASTQKAIDRIRANLLKHKRI